MKKEARISHSRLLGSVAIAATTAALLPPGLAVAQPIPADTHATPMETDLASRSKEIHWPAGFDPAAAALFAHNEVRINVNCERVWNQLIEARSWPKWYPNAQKVKLMHTYSTALKEGTVFRWETFGQLLESRVDEFVPSSRIGWYGAAPDSPPSFYHTFYLTPDGDGCSVVTEETGNGPVAAYLRKTDENAMHRGHDLWLASLKGIFEE
jgi:uncharacterized protein YndB with AHSA1/START domain